MGRTTSIEWAEHTWNPVMGCSLASPGCTNCYAMRMAERLVAMGRVEYAGLTTRRNGNPVWTGILRRAPHQQRDKVRRIAKPGVIFVNSMSDLFHPDMPDE